jgi:hypothetical protein
LNLDYLVELVRENGDTPEVLREILELARTGCIDHQGAIEDICGHAAEAPGADGSPAGLPSPDDCQDLVRAVHRLANIMAALRLETLARKLNTLERLGRDGNGLDFCREWWKIREEVDTVLDEVCRVLLSFSQSSDGEST